MTRILLVRHGRTEDAAARRYSGRRDVPLDEYGREQARILAGRLAGEAIDLALTSDLARAVLTAGIILGGRPVSAVPDPRLREIDFGLWEGLTHEEILARDGEAYRRWLDDPMAPIPSGECLPSMVERVLGCLTEAAGGPSWRWRTGGRSRRYCAWRTGRHSGGSGERYLRTGR